MIYLVLIMLGIISFLVFIITSKVDFILDRLKEIGPSVASIIRRQEHLQDQYDRIESKIIQIGMLLNELSKAAKIRTEVENAKNNLQSHAQKNTLVEEKKKRGRPKKNDGSNG